MHSKQTDGGFLLQMHRSEVRPEGRARLIHCFVEPCCRLTLIWPRPTVLPNSFLSARRVTVPGPAWGDLVPPNNGRSWDTIWQHGVVMADADQSSPFRPFRSVARRCRSWFTIDRSCLKRTDIGKRVQSRGLAWPKPVNFAEGRRQTVVISFLLFCSGVESRLTNGRRFVQGGRSVSRSPFLHLSLFLTSLNTANTQREVFF